MWWNIQCSQLKSEICFSLHVFKIASRYRSTETFMHLVRNSSQADKDTQLSTTEVLTCVLVEINRIGMKPSRYRGLLSKSGMPVNQYRTLDSIKLSAFGTCFRLISHNELKFLISVIQSDEDPRTCSAPLSTCAFWKISFLGVHSCDKNSPALINASSGIC